MMKPNWWNVSRVIAGLLVSGGVIAAQPARMDPIQVAARRVPEPSSPDQPIQPKGANPHIAVVMIGDPAPDFSLPDTSGLMHTLSSLRGKYVVLEWTDESCPFIKQLYGDGVMQEYQEELVKQGVVWFSMRSNGKGQVGYCDPKKAEAVAKEQGSRATAVLMDESGKTGRAYGAKVTPHMFMIDPQGALIYQGAIDDNPYGKMKPREETYRYLWRGFIAHKTGKPIQYSHTRAYGCSIHYGFEPMKTVPRQVPQGK